MSKNNDQDPQTELITKLMAIKHRFEPGGDHGPIDDTNHWDKIVASRGPEDGALLQELINFSNLWKFLEGQGKKLPESAIGALEQVHKLPVPDGIARLRQINQQLMQLVDSVSTGGQLRN